MNAAPVSVIFTLLTTATTTEYFVVDPQCVLTHTEAARLARERYYYDDAYHVEAERADSYELGGAHYAGWLVKVLH